MFSELRLVYKNMVWNRPKVGLFGLIAVALLTTTNLWFNLAKFGHPTQIVMSLIALGGWFFLLPCVLTLIDIHQSPKRMERLWHEMHRG